MKQTLSIFVFFLLVVSSSLVSAAESKGGLTVRESGANLYPQQDVESVPIAKLQKGEALIPVAEAIGQQTWYLVKTQQGLFGWVRGADVSSSDQVQVSTWSARTSTGRTFDGTWTIEPGSSADKASGTWTLSDGAATTTLRGTWSAQKFTTGWSGAWRAAVEGKPGELAGSWTADLPPARDARFTELFEAAARDAVRGVWNAGGNSGSWSIRAVK